VSGTLHCGNLTQRNPDGTTGPCHERTGISSGFRPCADCQSSYHTYSVLIDRRHASDEQIAWYLGGREYFSVSENRAGPAAWTACQRSGTCLTAEHVRVILPAQIRHRAGGCPGQASSAARPVLTALVAAQLGWLKGPGQGRFPRPPRAGP